MSDPGAWLADGVRFEGRDFPVFVESVGKIPVPSGELILSRDSWTFSGVPLPRMQPGMCPLERWVAESSDGWPVVLAVGVGDHALVESWAPWEDDDGTQHLLDLTSSGELVYDTGVDVLGLRGQHIRDGGPTLARKARAKVLKACLVAAEGRTVGAMVDLSNPPHRVWIGRDATGEAVMLLFDREVQRWLHREQPKEWLAEPLIKSIAMGDVALPTGRLAVTDPDVEASGAAPNVVVEGLPKKMPGTMWLADLGPSVRGCAVVLGNVKKVSTWVREEHALDVDAGVGLLGAADDAARVDHLAAPANLTSALRTMEEEGMGWMYLLGEGRIVGHIFDCGMGDGSYAVWTGFAESGKAVAVLIDLEVKGVGQSILDGDRR